MSLAKHSDLSPAVPSPHAPEASQAIVGKILRLTSPGGAAVLVRIVAWVAAMNAEPQTATSDGIMLTGMNGVGMTIEVLDAPVVA